MDNQKNEDSPRRKFLKYGLLAGGATLAGLGIRSVLNHQSSTTGEKVKVMTADGKLMEVDSTHLKHQLAESVISDAQARIGIEGKKFVMVIDLARCANARKCVDGCQKMHNKRPPIEWIKVKKMQDAEDTAPYWMA